MFLKEFTVAISKQSKQQDREAPAAPSVHFGLVYWRSLGLEYRASW